MRLCPFCAVAPEPHAPCDEKRCECSCRSLAYPRTLPNRPGSVLTMVQTPDRITVSISTEIICVQCGHPNRPDVNLAPFIQAFKEELMGTAQEVHDLVTQFADALTGIEARLDALSAQVADEAADAVSPEDVQGLRDELGKAKSLAASAQGITGTAIGGTDASGDLTTNAASGSSPTPPTPDTGQVSESATSAEAPADSWPGEPPTT